MGVWVVEKGGSCRGALPKEIWAAAWLTAAAVGSFLMLKLLGIVCWVLPVVGLLLPLLAMPVLWSGAAMLAVGSGALCWVALRRGERRRICLLLLTVDVAVLAVMLLVTAYLFGLIPRSWAWIWGPAAEIGSWFFHMPSAFALM